MNNQPHTGENVSEPVRPGVSGTLTRRVTRDVTTQRGELHIYSTPNVVLLLEEAAIEALRPHLEEGHDSVGSRVEIAHVAPTLEGQTVTAVASVTEVDRRRVAFDIVVRDDVEEIAWGTHERFVVQLDKFSSRLEDKREQVTKGGER
jgi:fluoroacetyl-CoA thioesterase